MKPKTLILAVVAVVCGLGAMWMTNRLLAEKTKENVAEKEAREKVLVAKAKIPSQTVFKDVDKWFEVKEVVASAIPKSAIRTRDKVQGKRLSRGLAEGDFVNPESLVSPESDGLGAVLAPGMRAVAIRVQPDSMVAGFVIPRSHVDVMCTVRTNDGSTTYTILENMEILAVDTKSAREGEAAAVVGTTVTLAASPEDCNLLKMAAGTGVLDLALRGIGDDKSTKPQAVTQKFLENPRAREGTDDKETTTVAQGKTKVPSLPLVPPGTATPPPAPVELAPKEPEPEVFVMTIINGPTIEKVRFTKKPGDTWPVEATTTKTPTATPAPGSAPVSAPASAPAAAPEPKANPPENKATRPETRKQPG